MRLLICCPPLRGSLTPVLVRPASPLIARCAVALTHQPITPCWTLLLNLGDMTLYIQRMACFPCFACPASNLALLQAKAEHCSIKRASCSGRSIEVREALEQKSPIE